MQEIKSKIVAVNNTISAIQKSKAEMEEVQQLQVEVDNFYDSEVTIPSSIPGGIMWKYPE